MKIKYMYYIVGALGAFLAYKCFADKK
jgi:hypothetical protein